MLEVKDVLTTAMRAMYTIRKGHDKVGAGMLENLLPALGCLLQVTYYSQTTTSSIERDVHCLTIG